MKVLLDTTILIAAILADHIHHAASRSWLSAAKSHIVKLVVSAHSIAEVYSVLTRLPRLPKISSGEAWQLIDVNVLQAAEVVSLTSDEYISLVAELSQRGIVGGQVYDAIIAKAAELARVEFLVTLNVTHFKKVWPAAVDRIVTLLEMSPPTLS